MFERIAVMVDGKATSVLIEENPLETSPHRLPCIVVGLSSHYHDKFSLKFRSRYKLILIDMYWTDTQFTPEYVNSLEMSNLSDHIEQVREQLENKLGADYKKIIVLGHSSYGFITLDYALKYSDKLLGIINIQAPLIFNQALLTKWQEDYLDSNFGNAIVDGPTERWHTYHAQKTAFTKKAASNSKQYFVESYLSKGTLFFSNPELWMNHEKKAEKIWEPWRIFVLDKEKDTHELEIRDINIPMIFHYMKLIKDRSCYEILPLIRVPVLWTLALGDLRISLYHLEHAAMPFLSENIEFFHPTDQSHWPMFEQDVSSEAFDEKAVSWGNKIIDTELRDEPTLSFR